MPTALVSEQFVARFGESLRSTVADAGKDVGFVTLPGENGARLPQADCDRIDCAFLDRDINFEEHLAAAFRHAVAASRSIRWLHVTSSGVNPGPHVTALVEKGATITTSTGSNAEPVAQTGITGLLMLARGFASHVRSQQRHEWRPLRGAALPDDLRGQTLVLIGVGAVGSTFARYARTFGLKVIGVRRSPMQPGDPVDEMHPPAKLAELLPRADWLVISCPLTIETRKLIDGAAIARMKKGARIINIGRGEVIDEAAVLQALQNGRLGGAYIDPFTVEPLPADSPFWDLPNVIITPHNASASTGNERRCAEMFIANFGHWVRGEPMFNIQRLS
jgi:phosphoglycerate dehydrogenase-like enzyme